MAPSPTIRRLLKETAELSVSSPNPNPTFHAAPVSDSNLHEWHFTLLGPPSPSVFAGGLYHGRITLPATYPLKPPNFRFLTPSGRFEVNREICLSISGFHEETWMPAWGVRTALTALRSFMAEKGSAGQVGGMEAQSGVRERLARESRSWRCDGCARGSNEEIMRDWWAVCREAGVNVEEEMALETLPEGMSLVAPTSAGSTTTAATDPNKEKEATKEEGDEEKKKRQEETGTEKEVQAPQTERVDEGQERPAMWHPATHAECDDEAGGRANTPPTGSTPSTVRLNEGPSDRITWTEPGTSEMLGAPSSSLSSPSAPQAAALSPSDQSRLKTTTTPTLPSASASASSSSSSSPSPSSALSPAPSSSTYPPITSAPAANTSSSPIPPDSSSLSPSSSSSSSSHPPQQEQRGRKRREERAESAVTTRNPHSDPSTATTTDPSTTLDKIIGFVFIVLCALILKKIFYPAGGGVGGGGGGGGGGGSGRGGHDDDGGGGGVNNVDDAGPGGGWYLSGD